MRRRKLLTTTGLSVLLALGATGTVLAAPDKPGAVYTLSNSAAGNAVLAYSRGADGTLSPIASYPTGGTGSGGGLGSQGALVLTDSRRILLAVDAGSDEITSFRVARDGALTWADRAPSGGDHPISVTVQDGLVYVLNDGGSGNIAALAIDGHGNLAQIPGSSRPLSGAGTGPAQVSFTPDGQFLVVTEKAANAIVTYAVASDGTASAPTAYASAGATPFGFDFDKAGRILVSEAFGGAPNASTVSSYAISNTGVVSVVDATVATTESAACWVVTTPNGKYAYTTNTGSGTVSGFSIDSGGDLTLLDADGVTGVTGAGTSPIDAGTSKHGDFLYVLDGGTDAISAFGIGSDGSLVPSAGIAGLPASSVGLASF
jgi:6-phosphogluconolactonase